MKKLNLLLLLCINFAFSQTQYYTPINDNFSNPDRGQYHYTKSGNYKPLDNATLLKWKTNEKITLVWREFSLNDFKTAPISNSYLTNMQSDFDKLRLNGVKCIVRFVYTHSSGTDATKAVILNHIEQLKPILQKNEDVISSLEAGFIGDYGEWYNSINFGTDSKDAKLLADRKEVGLAIMDLCPNRMVAFRTPYYQKLIAGNTPIDETNKYNGSILARTSAHNDCYLSGANDYGTYANEADKTYLESQSKYTFDGGETCSLTTYSECANAITQSERFHFNYLNIDYNATVLDYWKQQGCYDEIVRRLGYRFELVSTNLTNNIFTVKIKNVGFANVFNKRNIYLVAQTLYTNQQTTFQFDQDIRYINAGETTEFSIDLSELDGTYRLMIWIPDNENTAPLKPDYSIRFANLSVWLPESGYNDLGRAVTISKLSVIDNKIQVKNFDNYKIEVFDISGKLLSTSNDISNLSNGIYIVKVNNDKQVLVRKIVKK